MVYCVFFHIQVLHVSAPREAEAVYQCPESVGEQNLSTLQLKHVGKHSCSVCMWLKHAHSHTHTHMFHWILRVLVLHSVGKILRSCFLGGGCSQGGRAAQKIRSWREGQA